MLLISKSMDFICISFLCLCVNPRPQLFRSSASSFSSKYLLLFRKSSRRRVFLLSLLLLLSFPPSVLQWHHEEGTVFSEYDQSNWLSYVIYYLEVPSSLLYIQVFVHYLLSLVILSPLFSSSNTFQSSPNTSAPIFLVSRSLSHIKQCSKHNT